ncbi:hypothetical protein ILUMI_24377 [Ignelater luminosus]|uniref:Nose resistant-to-fluoxetine protein N-terminal domain-containing protein n=1 Tax=Ignelater luminosus TaxID=2038154 RepID=A0A8K0G0Q9_IGNLU|nr:hypothetical protein ILUMI_24377 [Ignelater luminosus]
MRSKLFNIILISLCTVSYSNGETNLLQNFETVNVFETFASAVRNYPLIPEKKVSVLCLAHLLKYVNSIEKEWWAYQMYDASTKHFPGSGVLNGNLVHFGDYDECLNVTSTEDEIAGKYCLATVPLEQFIPKKDLITTKNPETRVTLPESGTSPAFALCLPDSCSAIDLNHISALVPVHNLKIKFNETLCNAKSEQGILNSGDITAISVLSVILLLVLISTIYEVVMHYKKQKIYHPILTAFSAFANTKKIVQTSDEPGQITCLHGIRVISMMWVVFGHRYSYIFMIPKSNLSYLFIDYIYQKTTMFAAGATVSVDTFLVLSGLLVSYGFMVSTSRGSKFNIIRYYIHRIIRLTPLLGAVMLVHGTFLRHMGDGPLWKLTTTKLRDPCVENWWTTLLYVQNYVTPGNGICIRQSWYLGVDTQLYLLSPIILLPLRKWPKVGIILTLLFMVASIIASFVVGWIEELYGHVFTNTNCVLITGIFKTAARVSAEYYWPKARSDVFKQDITYFL